jgi:signal peptidase II
MAAGIMRKIDWILVIFPIFIAWGIDQATKAWALGLTNVEFYGPLGLALHHNHGVMLGLFKDATPVIRVVSLSTGGAFLLFVFAVIQYLLPIKSLILRSGMAVLLGSILGNVTDRIVYGHVIDFIFFKSGSYHTPVFNLADALQWCGYLMIAYALVRKSHILWPENDTRKRLWINPRFQLRYCFMLMVIGFGFAAIAGVYAYTFLRVTIIDFAGNNPRLLDNYLTPFLVSFAIVSLTFSLALFLVGRVLSARIAGPLYAFEKFLEDLTNGKPRPLRLRAGDEFKHLEATASKLIEKLIEQKVLSQPQDSAPTAAPVDDEEKTGS